MLVLSQFFMVAEALLTLLIRINVFLLMLSSIPLNVHPFVSSANSSSKSSAKSYFPSSSFSSLTVGVSFSSDSSTSSASSFSSSSVSPSSSALALSLASFSAFHFFCSACYTLQKLTMSLNGSLKLQFVIFAATFVRLPRASNQSPSTTSSFLN